MGHICFAYRDHNDARAHTHTHTHTHTHRRYMLVDPSLKEELVMEGNLVVGINTHHEVCVIQMSGGVPLHSEQVCGAGG